MARIAGVNIPTNKRVEIALTYIHGIGSTSAKSIVNQLGITPERCTQDLSAPEVLKMREFTDRDLHVEGDIRSAVAMHLKRQLDLDGYCGSSYRQGLTITAHHTYTK